jgi:type II secretory pathway pseudopilin PulG
VLRRLRTEEAGWTLIEVMVGMVLSLLVCSLALDLIPRADSSSRGSLAREAATVSAQAAAARITREARAASAAAVQSPSVLDLIVPLRQPGAGLSAPAHIRYDCSGGRCVRTLCTAPIPSSLVGAPCAAAAPGSVVVDGLADGDVFAGVLGTGAPQTSGVGISSAATPSMDRLRISLRLSLSDGHLPVEIDDGTSFADFSL